MARDETGRPDEQITSGQAAAILGVSRMTVSTYARQGLLAYWETRLGRLYSRREVYEFREERRERSEGSE
jgi:predicted site-specific integrase-resolvase